MATLKNTIVNDTGYLKIASGSTAQRVGATPNEFRFNTDSNYKLFEAYASSGWHNLSPYGLSIYSITPVSGVTYISGTGLEINPAVSGVFQINGFNFTPSTTVWFDSFQVPAGDVVINSPKLITVTTGTSGITSGSYSTIVVKNEMGQSSTLSYPVIVGGGPQFSTSTLITTVVGGTSISTSVSASSPGATITYSANSTPGNGGSGYGLPAGLSLNASTGAITGTLTVPAGQSLATYNLTIKATDSNTISASKDFIIIATSTTSPTITAPSAGNLTTLYYVPGISQGTTALVSGQSFSTTIMTPTTSNPVGGSLSYKITSGNLPPGIVLNSLTGVLSGSFQIGSKQPALSTYYFGVSVTDANNNTSAEVQYNISVSVPYFYRQILTTGYAAAGYQSGTPYKNVNRVSYAAEISVSLGDQLQIAVNYHTSSCGPDKGYQYGVPTTVGNQISGQQTQIYNMRTESSYYGTNMTYGGRLHAGALCSNDGFATTSYISGGFTGTNSNAIERWNHSTEAYSIVSGQTTSTTNLGEGSFNGSTETYGCFQGGTSLGTASSYIQQFTYSTETLSSWGVYLSASCQQKFIPSKLNKIYGGDGGTYGNTGSTNFRKTVWTTQEQFTMQKGYGTGATGTGTASSCGEEVYTMGQDFGYCIGNYDGSQNTNAWKFYFATDTGTDANTGLQRRGIPGASSGNGFWRD